MTPTALEIADYMVANRQHAEVIANANEFMQKQQCDYGFAHATALFAQACEHFGLTPPDINNDKEAADEFQWLVQEAFRIASNLR